MKFRNIIKTAIAFVFTLTCQLVVAGTISDTYETGNVLTQENMDNIKAAVNDNATKTGTAGVGFASSTDDFPLINVPSTIQSVTLTVPGPGFIIVSFSAYYRMFHTNGTRDSITVGISESINGDLGNIASRRILLLDSGYPGGNFYNSVASHAVFTVAAAGTITYYVLGQSNKTVASTSFYVSHPATQAIFVPNRYQTLSNPVLDPRWCELVGWQWTAKAKACLYRCRCIIWVQVADGIGNRVEGMDVLRRAIDDEDQNIANLAHTALDDLTNYQSSAD